jgi:hypothetical protein
MRKSIVSFIFKPLLIIMLITGVFSLVYLRSSVLKLEYSLAELEKKKAECLKERKMLLAQKTSLLSFGKLETTLNKTQGFVIPDRIKVIHINKAQRVLPHKTSLERERWVEP